MHGGSVIIAYHIDGLHALHHHVDICREKLAVESQLIRILCFKKVFVKALLLKVFFAQYVVHGSHEIRRFLLSLVGCHLETVIRFKAFRKSIELPYLAGILIISQWPEIVLSGSSFRIEIHPGRYPSLFNVLEAAFYEFRPVGM